MTGHEGFDYYYEQFTGLIDQLELSLKVQDDETTAELLKEARESILPAMAVERKVISSSLKRKHPGLKYHLTEVYDACQMQLQTYQMLSEQPAELFHDLPQDDNNEPISRASNSSQQHDRNLPKSVASSSKSSLNSREELFSGNNNFAQQQSHRHINVQAKTQGRVMEQNTQLEAAMRSIRESEQIACETIEELQSQRKTLDGTRRKVDDLTSMTTQAKQLVKSINRPWWKKW
jgi:hypothetical protein